MAAHKAAIEETAVPSAAPEPDSVELIRRLHSLRVRNPDDIAVINRSKTREDLHGHLNGMTETAS